MADVPVNFYSGAPLNRLSWLRTSSKFLNSAVLDPTARWLLMKNLNPLVAKSAEGHGPAYLTTSQVKPLLGEDKVFGQGEEQAPFEEIGEDVIERSLKSARIRGPRIVFLGVKAKEGVQALPSAEFKSANDLPGAGYFALDVTKIEPEALQTVLEGATENGTTLEFMESRTASASYSIFDAPVFSLARSMIDWNARNRFCAGCGSPVISLWGGWKLSCSTLLPWSDNTGREPCISGTGLHNFAYPRTDAVVIMAILDDKADRILLAHNKRHVATFYSTLAGFVEPSEAFEDAVKREVYEESGVEVYDVRYHSAQPWPWPSNLMIGFYAFADSTQKIRLDLDTELHDAKWFTREEVIAIIEHPDGTNLNNNKPSEEATKVAPPPFRIPPASQTIAGVLISEWAYGRAPGPKPTGSGHSRM